MKIGDRLKEYLPVTRKQILALHRHQARIDQYLADYIVYAMKMQEWLAWHRDPGHGPKPQMPTPPALPEENT